MSANTDVFLQADAREFGAAEIIDALYALKSKDPQATENLQADTVRQTPTASELAQGRAALGEGRLDEEMAAWDVPPVGPQASAAVLPEGCVAVCRECGASVAYGKCNAREPDKCSVRAAIFPTSPVLAEGGK